MGRKRDRSKTPEVPWELLPSGDGVPVAPIAGAELVQPKASRSQSADRPSAEVRNGGGAKPVDPALVAAAAANEERDAWRRLVIVLAQSRGDRKVEALLKERHPELLQVAEKCGASGKATMTLQAAKDSAREWFARGLRGGNQHGPAARAKLCKQLAGQLQEHAASVCSSATAAHIASVLERGRPEEEGPLICATMARELRGSRYEGLWISRKGPAGHYYLGDEHEGANLPSTDKDGDPIHPRVHAVVKVVNEQLVISGFFLDPEDDTMSPAKVPIGPFLSVYFEGMSVREASAAWKGGPPARPRPAPKVKQGPITDPKLKELQAGLPPGWEVRESRSKKGIYFFAHPSSGRSQMAWERGIVGQRQAIKRAWMPGLALTRAKHADAVQLLRLPAENCFGRGITAFDKSYTQFERLYMTIVEQLMEASAVGRRTNQEHVQYMTGDLVKSGMQRSAMAAAQHGFSRMSRLRQAVLSLFAGVLFWSSFLEQDRRDSELNAVRQLHKQLAQEKGLVASFTAAAAAAEKKAEAAAIKLKEAEAQLAAKVPDGPSLSSVTQKEAPLAPLGDSAPPPGHYTSIGLAAVADKKYQKRFAISIASQRCYAKKHGYEYAVIDPSEYPACDKFRDFFFRKHCSVARFLETTVGDHILFVFDGDNPVVWLDRGLDHWLKEVAATDVVLYERWMNNEIMAGNYAVRNSDFGIRFLDDWASFEEELPRSGYHSSDNGAIHLHLLRVLGLKNEKPCKYQWDHLGSDRDHMDEYYGFVTCARLVMGAPRRWKIAGTPRVTILPRGHAWAIDGGDADSHVSSVGAISHHGQKTEANYRQYFQDSFVDNGGSDCDVMVRKGFYVDPRQYGDSLWSKLKARTDGAMLDWTRQHVPPWDFAYLGCMATLSCRPLDDGEALSVSIPRPVQSSIPFKKVPKDAKFEVCAGEWETCKCVGLVYFGTKTRRSPVVEVQAGEGKIDCRADNFDGDPAIGEIKKCHCAPVAEKRCDALLSTSGDPFREVQAASLCQRLGLLKQDVDFGGSNQVMHFDSSLLEKAHRVLQMETYAEVQEMARALIQDFESLCKVLLHLNDNQAKPELKENAELTSAILRLEQVWADCQFILHQGCLDFIEVLEREVLPQLSPMLRWQIRVALGFSEGRPLDPEVTQADIKAAKVALYQTVPMMVYVEELWRDANPEESSRKLRFVELCCPQDDRHHTLRRDFGKFDEKRFNEFRTFITDDEQNRGGANRQTDFFRLVYRQLKAVAAFPVQENFAAAVLAASKAQENLKQPGLSDQDIAVVQREQELLEGGARWICLMLKVQAVAPGLFPKKPPEKSDRDRPRHNSKGRRMSAATHLAGRRGSTVNAWEALEAVKEG
ncbi:unnamed protein product [Symbiodinium sp. CCMP2592]|nr:unnamed protein product [Symbiodinium sp. CCMP2592]